MLLHPARADESGLLSELALASKGHWGYDPEFLAAFYRAMGAVRVGGTAAGSIPGRTLPRLVYPLV